jgi:SAM-dependent methyltransferase
VRYYHLEHVDGYQKMKEAGMRSWGELHGHPDDFEHFSSRPFLDEVLPRLRFELESPRALELGCGTGPGACYLASRGFRVRGIDLIPTAIETARALARDRHLEIDYAVMDVTQIPHEGLSYDLIVDSYCLQGIVLGPDREKVFAAVRARLQPRGYYLVSTAMYAEHRHHPEDRLVDPASERVFHRYDDHDLFDPETGILYALVPESAADRLGDRSEDREMALTIDGRSYLPRRRYRTPEGLASELEAHGFRVLLQTGVYGENVVCVHRDGPVKELALQGLIRSHL